MDDTLLKIETLEKEYSILLNQYEEAYKNYMSSLSKNNEFISIKGKTWWGKNPLSQSIVSNIQECITTCAKNSQCSGATFNQTNNYCWTRTGETTLTSGSEDEFALITNMKSQLLILDYLNQKLIEINKQILMEFNNIDLSSIDNKEQQQQLNNNYMKLVKEQETLNNMLANYNDINTSVLTKQLIVEQSSASLRLWLFITIIIVLFTINQIFFGFPLSGTFLFRMFIVIIFIMVAFTLHTRQGFLMAIIILLLIFFIIVGFIPL
jgi:hypothetical protein